MRVLRVMRVLTRVLRCHVSRLARVAQPWSTAPFLTAAARRRLADTFCLFVLPCLRFSKKRRCDGGRGPNKILSCAHPFADFFNASPLAHTRHRFMCCHRSAAVRVEAGRHLSGATAPSLPAAPRPPPPQHPAAAARQRSRGCPGPSAAPTPTPVFLARPPAGVAHAGRGPGRQVGLDLRMKRSLTRALLSRGSVAGNRPRPAYRLL